MMTKIESHPNVIKIAFYTAVIKRKIFNCALNEDAVDDSNTKNMLSP